MYIATYAKYICKPTVQRPTQTGVHVSVLFMMIENGTV